MNESRDDLQKVAEEGFAELGVATPSLTRNISQPPERMMKWFAFEHLPSHLQEVSKSFHDQAAKIVASIEPGPERTVALRKLLEAKDAAVRAKLNPDG